MRLLLSLYLFAGPIGVAAAHTLPGAAGIADQLAHQVLGLHHLPLLALIVVAAAVLCRMGIAALRR